MWMDVLGATVVLGVVPLMSWLIIDSVERGKMKAFYVFSGVISVGLLVYLFVAVLKPALFG
jgi:K+-transporting ATPase KdpF subunit